MKIKDYKMLKGDRYKPWVPHFFDKYSPSLNAGVKNGSLTRSAQIEQESDLYLCPICLDTSISRDQNFIDQIIKHQPDIDFDRDHYPAKSIGGKDEILVCVNCNNGYGVDIDAKTKKFLEARYFKAQINGSSIGLNIKVPWLADPIDLKSTWNNSTLTSHVKKDFNPPEIPLPKGPLTAQFSFEAPIDKIFRRALLRSAYLKCFAFWGYSFATSGIAKRLVQVINQTISHPSESQGVYFVKGNCPSGGIYEYNSPVGKYFLVFFKIGLSAIPFFEHIFVIIPFNTESSWNGLASFGTDKVDISGPLLHATGGIESGEYDGYRKYSK